MCITANNNRHVHSIFNGHQSKRVLLLPIKQTPSTPYFLSDEFSFSFSYSNGTIFILKICVWLYTGSHSMFAESIHSVADTVNQIILAFGLHKSAKVNFI